MREDQPVAEEASVRLGSYAALLVALVAHLVVASRCRRVAGCP